MNKKLLGGLTPVFISLGMIVVAIITSVVVNQTSSDGWAALGAILMVFMLAGIVLFIFLIVAIVKYVRGKQDYWLGVLFGYGALVGISFVLSIFTAIYNALV